MNIIYVTICRITDVNEKDINTDLIRRFRDSGHNVYVVTPRERKFKIDTRLTKQDGVI